MGQYCNHGQGFKSVVSNNPTDVEYEEWRLRGKYKCCPKCEGAGWLVRGLNCPNCSGSGRIRVSPVV